MNEIDIDWNQLRTFYLVAQHGSFTGAGRAIGFSQSAVSRHVALLEESLGVSLFTRSPSGVQLTEPGLEVKAAAQDILSRITLLERRLEEYMEVPQGPLRITTSLGFGSAWLSSRMNKFISEYPGIAVSVVLSDDNEIDLYRGDADVAIRFGLPTQPNLVQKKFMTFRFRVFTSKEYLQSVGEPKSAKDLDNHKIIVFGDETPAPIPGINWLLEAGREEGAPREATLKINSIYGIYRAVRSGLGIAALPQYLVDDTPNLVEILPGLDRPSIDSYFVYPEEYRRSKRVSALRDFLLKEAKAFMDDEKLSPAQNVKWPE